MKASVYQAAIPHVLFFLQAAATLQGGPPTVVRTSSAGALETLDTEGNKELEEWLAANIRTPPSMLKPCPLPCSEAPDSINGGGWFLVPDATSFAQCNKTLLLDLVVKSDDPPALRACTADYGSNYQLSKIHSPDDGNAALCSTPNHEMVKTSIRLLEVSTPTQNNDTFATQHLVSASRQVMHYLASQKPSCSKNALAFGYSQTSVVGVFAGAEVHQHGLAIDIINSLLSYATERSISQTTVLQLCQEHGLGADYSFGLVATNANNLKFAQEAVRRWASGKCVGPDGGRDWKEVTIRVPSIVRPTNTTASSNMTGSRLGSRSFWQDLARVHCKTLTVRSGDGCWALAKICGVSQSDLTKYNRRANFCDTLVVGEKVCCTRGILPSSIPDSKSDGTCVTKEVKSGDSCGSLASKCGLSASDFMRLNTKEDLCSTLAEGQQVCCSRGELQDRRPKPESDGTCASVKTNRGDSCASIAASRDLTVRDIESFNEDTWGWNGCKVLWVGFRLCVSEGKPPMPEPVSNAVCGPTVPGTKAPAKGFDLSRLNPCPLKACCNVWGQCGLSDDFCIESKSETGAPGTSGVRNGCISNCGRAIIRSSPPPSVIKIAYFEAWNHKRSCLWMDIDDIDTTKYSHIHFAFGEVTKDFRIDISKVQTQFYKLKAMVGVKRIISLGGWDFSALPGTYNILREAVQPRNRDKFITNIVDFLIQHDLDGVDLDWEYPGATPSSYWYLKAFPISLMAMSLDYIVFMTYDLHGQWDYGNKWTSPGCPAGNCLRSHVNMTETKDALVMITKAGVPSNKVVVGVASYGRSFKMAEAGCYGPLCKFTGTPRISHAAKGRCTDTSGYIANAEIEEILASGKVTKQWREAGSNILVYDDTEWVAYMDDKLKDIRTQFYLMNNFAGTTDWAVDLQKFLPGDGIPDDDFEDEYEPYIDPDFYSDCSGKYSTLGDVEKHLTTMPTHCTEKYIAQAESAMIKEALTKHLELLQDDYDSKFKTYERFVKQQVPVQINNFMASDKVHQYFKCSEYKKVICCSDCTYATCLETCANFAGCKSGYQTLDIKCPQQKDELEMISMETTPNATFHLEDEEGFWKEIGSQYGIEEAWVAFGRRHMRTANGCQYAGKAIHECQNQNDRWWYNYPIAADDKIKVYNPKKIFGDSTDTIASLAENLDIIKDLNIYDTLMLWSDVVDAASLPALTLQAAVENMKSIIDKAEEIEKKQKEEFILNMVMGILFFIPVVGEAAGSAGLTAARSMLRLIGAAGDAGMTVYDIVKDPSNAFMAAFGYVLGAGVGRSGFRDAANSRRAVRPRELAAVGSLKTDLRRIQVSRKNICYL
ncbi:hypothetical protein H633G_03370 [Metarhizium anisopliae BRIP 53284]|nr:hypothetical protein H633G_03370 [Metarhizium anisopliae BRIP 53284]